MKREVIAYSDSCAAMVDTGASHIQGPRGLVNNIQKLIGAKQQGSKRKGHAAASLPVYEHNKDLHSQPLNLSLHFIFCGQYSALYYLHHQWHQLPSASSSLHPQGEGTILRVGSQTGACRNHFAATGRRAPSRGHITPLQMLLSPVAGPVPPTKPIT